MGFLLEGILGFKMAFGLLIKTAKNTKITAHAKQLKTATSHVAWAYIWEGLLSEGYLRLRFVGLIFGRVYFWRDFRYRNFTVS